MTEDRNDEEYIVQLKRVSADNACRPCAPCIPGASSLPAGRFRFLVTRAIEARRGRLGKDGAIYGPWSDVC